MARGLAGMPPSWFARSSLPVFLPLCLSPSRITWITEGTCGPSQGYMYFRPTPNFIVSFCKGEMFESLKVWRIQSEVTKNMVK